MTASTTRIITIFFVSFIISNVYSWNVVNPPRLGPLLNNARFRCPVVYRKIRIQTVLDGEKGSDEETTNKFDLETIFQSFNAKDDGKSTKDLLSKYGIAYLVTSIPLAILSFTICYVLVDNGVDVAGLLSKIGINGGDSEKLGTFAIAYTAHKAASPLRFPPTVALTPAVAKLIGKEVVEDEVARDD